MQSMAWTTSDSPDPRCRHEWTAPPRVRCHRRCCLGRGRNGGRCASQAGYRQRLLTVPTWFDEGVAMQVDYRGRYALVQQDTADADVEVDSVRELTTGSRFFVDDDQGLTGEHAAGILEPVQAETSPWLVGGWSQALKPSGWQRSRCA